MTQVVLIGLAAGAVAGLMFASLASGSVLAMALFYLAPLPILIAALGWSHVAAMTAAFAGSVALFVAFNAVFALAFLIGVGWPAWWLGYLALLARPVGANGSERLEWYPVGRIVFWAAVLGAAIVTAAVPQFGTDAESFRATLRSGFERAFRLQTGTADSDALKLPGVSDTALFFEFFAVVIPPAAAAVTAATLLFNLWLAAKVVNLSGRLRRPWPDIASLTLPVYAAPLLALAVAGTFLPGLAGIIAGLFAASLTVAYAALGLAVLHSIARPLKSGAILLAGAYAAIVLLGWPLLAIMLLGLADTWLDLRARMARKRGPPTAPTV